MVSIDRCAEQPIERLREVVRLIPVNAAYATEIKVIAQFPVVAQFMVKGSRKEQCVFRRVWNMIALVIIIAVDVLAELRVSVTVGYIEIPARRG